MKPLLISLSAAVCLLWPATTALGDTLTSNGDPAEMSCAAGGAHTATGDGGAATSEKTVRTDGASIHAVSPLAPPTRPVPVAATSMQGAPGGQASEPQPAAPAQGQAGQAANAQEIAKKLANPISSVTSVPFQMNFDFGLGPNENGTKFTLNIQPVIPVPLGAQWNLITRLILPVVHQNDVVPGTSQSGLSDATLSFFLSPNKTEPFIWGVGPVILIPTATDRLLGAGKLGLGPTAVVLKQSGGTTVGALLNHIWSVAGSGGRPDVSSTFMQPFLAHSLKSATTFTLNTESTYNWETEQWSVPILFQFSQVTRFGTQLVQWAAGIKYWATTPEGGPKGFGFRFAITPLFPKG